MQKSMPDVLKMFNVIFNACIKYWGLTPCELSELIKRYNLFSYVEENEELLNSYGPKGLAQVLESYVKESGGAIR